MKKLKKLNVNKSPGPDGLHPKVLSELAHELAEPLTIIFTKSLQQETLPQAWKDAKVTPLYKKGGKRKPGNYRPVSLTSIICKIMESIVRDQVVGHMASNNLFSDAQHGFISGRSCSTNLIAVLDKWSEALDNGLPVDAIYLDFAKAFDSVPHIRLLTKLKGYGIDGNVCGWIRQFLIGRRQRVQVGGSLSNWAPVTSGIPQGSVLGPILFVIFINDMPSVVNSYIELFADDSKVFHTIQSDEDRLSLQEDLNHMVDWSNKWQLRFNAAKCKVLHIGRSNPKFDYSMTDTDKNIVTLEKTELEKDLGVNVDPQLKFSNHVEIQVNKCNKILGLIRRSYDYLDADSLKSLFCALVRPHLEFCNVVWSPRLAKDRGLIESVLRRATKLVSHVKDLPYEERLAKLKIPSMSYRRARGDMIEVYKYVNEFYSVKQKPFQFEESSITRGHRFKLKKNFCKTSTRQHFFGNRVVETWNNLPSPVVEAPTLNCFKARLDRALSAYKYKKDVCFPLVSCKTDIVDILDLDRYPTDQLIGSKA